MLLPFDSFHFLRRWNLCWSTDGFRHASVPHDRKRSDRSLRRRPCPLVILWVRHVDRVDGVYTSSARSYCEPPRTGASNSATPNLATQKPHSERGEFRATAPCIATDLWQARERLAFSGVRIRVHVHIRVCVRLRVRLRGYAPSTAESSIYRVRYVE